jgi:hypothetical protein
MSLAFTITDKELEASDKWVKQHEKECHKGKTPYAGAIGGLYSYRFVPTSLGTFVSIECAACKSILACPSCKTGLAEHLFGERAKHIGDITDLDMIG